MKENRCSKCGVVIEEGVDVCLPCLLGRTTAVRLNQLEKRVEELEKKVRWLDYVTS